MEDLEEEMEDLEEEVEDLDLIIRRRIRKRSRTVTVIMKRNS